MRIISEEIGDKIRYYGIDVESCAWASIDISKRLRDAMGGELNEYVRVLLSLIVKRKAVEKK